MLELFSRNLTPEEEDAVAAFMKRVAVLPDAQRAPLPDPTVLWWKAQFVRRWNNERKAQAPQTGWLRHRRRRRRSVSSRPRVEPMSSAPPG